MAAQHSFPADRETWQASPWLGGWDRRSNLGTPRGTHGPLRHHWVYAIHPASGHVLAGLSAFTGSAPGGIHLGSAVLAHRVGRVPGPRTVLPRHQNSVQTVAPIQERRAARQFRPVVFSYQDGGKQIAPRSPADATSVGGR